DWTTVVRWRLNQRGGRGPRRSPTSRACRRSGGVEAGLAHHAVRTHLEQSRWSHGSPRFFVRSFVRGLLLTGGVTDPQTVQVNTFRIEVVGIGIVFDDDGFGDADPTRVVG